MSPEASSASALSGALLVERARELQPLVRSFADRAEALRTLPDEVVRALREAGLFRVAVAREVGGAEATPREQILAIEAISEADGAAGWALMIGVENLGFASALLLPDVAEEVIAKHPEVIFCGALNPSGPRDARRRRRPRQRSLALRERLPAQRLVLGPVPHRGGRQAAGARGAGAAPRLPRARHLARRGPARLGKPRRRGRGRVRGGSLHDPGRRRPRARARPAVPAAAVLAPGVQQGRRGHGHRARGARRVRRARVRAGSARHERAAARAALRAGVDRGGREPRCAPRARSCSRPSRSCGRRRSRVARPA